jgi:sulfite reductase subunit B
MEKEVRIEGEPDLYIPTMCLVATVRQLTETEKLFDISYARGLGHQPGQFVQVWVPGVGEAPISVCSWQRLADGETPAESGTSETFQICVRSIGSVTRALHQLSEGEKIGIRGPYGHGFPVKEAKGKDALIIAGGIGLPPLRSLVQYFLHNRKDLDRLILLYGAQRPDELLFREDLAKWAERGDMEVELTVDEAAQKWKGRVGVITTLIPPLRLDVEKTLAFVVGPPLMYKFVITELKEEGIADENIFLSLERVMRCGVGKCGHCTIGEFYTCIDGPVFRLSQIKDTEALG